ncbi:Rpn family recombination-promoting nuclease/putative transposase [Treponema socranskii]|uniref:Rpn family recombination-promoting nuclease/putative transposase n=2 Tax=Treponema TaxID=157 RepID=UPI003D9205F8
MRKSFDELTIADDYMFCAVMEDAALCKKLLNIVLSDTIGTITELNYQKTFAAGSSKGIRLDVWAGDDRGKLYDIEMQTTDQKNLAKRLRYYQSAIDVGILNKGGDYNDLPDTFIIFFCTFDYPNRGRPVYTFKNFCEGDPDLLLPDGTTKVILNSAAAAKETNPELKALLEYMNGIKGENGFIGELESKIREVKENNERRREYMIMTAFEADARRVGIAQGFSRGEAQGFSRGEAQGFSAGSHQKALETAQILKQLGDSVQKIVQATGLSKEEVEKL